MQAIVIRIEKRPSLERIPHIEPISARLFKGPPEGFPVSCKYPPAEPGALGIGPLEAAVRVADAALHSLAT